MYRVALKMLFGDRSKYLSLVFGLSFAILLITQQGSIFLGLLLRSTGHLQNVEPDLWVADKHSQYILEIRPIASAYLQRVRSVPGVAYAEPFFNARIQCELPNGAYKSVALVGIDRSTMVGHPPQMIRGNLDDLRVPDAVLIEESSRSKLNNADIGTVLKLNDHRAVVVGICRAKLGFESNALLYTTFENALNFTPTGRNKISFMIVKVKDGVDVKTVQDRINAMPDIAAFTQHQMLVLTSRFVLFQTGIGINFGITVVLGFVVGLVVVATTLYQFTLENLRHFAVLKAMGARTGMLVRMILLQALTVGLIGFGIGVGLASAFDLSGRRPGAELASFFPWQLMVASFIAMCFCVSAGSLLSLRRVITLEPGIVFK